jgi:hypothetical protein
MAYTAPKARIEWMWKTNADPWFSLAGDEWSSYSDVETATIEEAFEKKLPEVLTDDYHIDFKHSVQISNKNENNQRPVKRISRERSTSLREARFMPNPIHSSTPFIEQCLLLGALS